MALRRELIYINGKHDTRQEERDRVKDKILEKYSVPLLRFATNGSNEKMKLMEKLSEIQN